MINPEGNNEVGDNEVLDLPPLLVIEAIVAADKGI